MSGLSSPGHAGEPSHGTEGRGPRHPKPPEDLAARYPLRFQEIRLQSGVLRLFTLVDPDALLDTLTQEEFDRGDGRMPYWAAIWPSALALADVVLAGPRLEGRRVVDLGCGLGPVGLAALDRGARVTFLDWEEAAVRLAVASAVEAGHRDAEAVVCDWRSPPPLPAFDLVLGADLLYEERNAPAVARFLAAHLAPDGEAWIVDPGRLHARGFPGEVAAAGLALRAQEPLPPRSGAGTLTLWRVARA